jgi:hypothetical protein
MNTEMQAWMTKKRPALESAEAAYRNVVEIQPTAPPRWMIDSAERVGTMWMDFVDDCQRVPRPADFDNRPDFAAQYASAISEAASPLRTRALQAYAVCVEYSDKYRIEDDQSRICRKRAASGQAP